MVSVSEVLVECFSKGKSNWLIRASLMGSPVTSLAKISAPKDCSDKMTSGLTCLILFKCMGVLTKATVRKVILP